MPTFPAHEHFWPRMLQATLPLLIWAMHFFCCYIVTAEQARLSKTGFLATLMGASLLALSWLSWLVWRTVHRVHASRKITLLGWASASMAVLAWIAVALSCLPLVLLASQRA